MLWMKKDRFSKSFDVTFDPTANIYIFFSIMKKILI